MIWEELVKTALLGTDQKSLPAEVLTYLKEQGIDITLEAPSVLAQGIALINQYRKAGFPLKTCEAETVHFPDSDSRNYEYPPIAKEYILETFREAEHGFGVSHFEILDILKKKNKFLPPEVLPALFEKKKNYASFDETYQYVEPFWGPIGRWLIGQHPKWRLWTSAFKLEEWADADDEKRLIMFQKLHLSNPQGAIDLLSGNWENEPFTTKTNFIDAFEIGLSGIDEPFLENCLKDTSTKVRFAATRLLNLLPESAQATKMIEEAAACISLRQGELMFKPSKRQYQKPDKDIFLPAKPINLNYGAETQLWNLFSTIYPTKWEELFKVSPAEFITCTLNSHYGNIIQAALAVSATWHKNKQWAEVLIASQISNSSSPIWMSEKLCSYCEPEFLNQLIKDFFGNYSGLPESNAGVFHLLSFGFKTTWPTGISAEVLHRFNETLSREAGKTMSSDSKKQWFITITQHGELDKLDKLPQMDYSKAGGKFGMIELVQKLKKKQIAIQRLASM